MNMMAYRLYGLKDLRWMRVNVPELMENEVLIHVKYCGICGTDQSIYSGESSFWKAGLIDIPMTPGHEYSGVVEAVGKKVRNFKIGDRVVSDTGVSCGVCDACREGNYFACSSLKAVGTIKAYDGGYAEYSVMPERHVFMLPDEVTFEQGALVEPVSNGLNSVKMGNIKIGDDVVIIGTGPIGLGAVPFAALVGARKVILIGRKDFKLEIGKKFGADVTINATKENLHDRVMEVTNGKGADVVIEASGSLDMMNQAILMAKNNCRVSFVAFYDKPFEKLNLDLMIIRNIQLIPVPGCGNMGPVVIKMMESGKVNFTPMITQIVPLVDAEKELMNFKENSGSRIKTLLKV